MERVGAVSPMVAIEVRAGEEQGAFAMLVLFLAEDVFEGSFDCAVFEALDDSLFENCELRVESGFEWVFGQNPAAETLDGVDV